MAYTDAKKNAVLKAIEDSGSEYLDNYIIASIKDKATEAMDSNNDKYYVADAVHDYIYKNFMGDITISTAIKQCMPKDAILLLRNKIINELS